MIYRILRWISGIAVHWFYGEIRITNRERIPERGSLFIAVNHRNALVDSLITSWVVPRRVTITAKATLSENPFIALLFRILGVIPLRRMTDERLRSASSIPDHSRNSKAFREILEVLERGGAVLIFPEGQSHDKPGLEPLKSGLARLALSARDDRSIRGVRILPLGLVFEDKGSPGSRVGVHIGEPIEMDEWPNSDHAALTAHIFRRLREVSERADVPAASPQVPTRSTTSLKRLLISGAAAWGRITHELPVTMARRIALRQSRDADQPAMLTMILGIALALLTYAVVFAVINVLIHSIWIACLYVASLVVGAYWAAFEDRRSD
jgi:1-acyl-sn-glycerol-3-phosphate acyltransferase